jgi:hypothetical protein
MNVFSIFFENRTRGFVLNMYTGDFIFFILGTFFLSEDGQKKPGFPLQSLAPHGLYTARSGINTAADGVKPQKVPGTFLDGTL